MKKMISFLFSLSVLAILTFSCDAEKGDGGEAVSEMIAPTANFKAVFGNEPLRMFEGTYAFSGDLDLRLQLFQFYVSDIGLLKTENGVKDTTFISDIDLVSFGEVISADDAAKGISLTLDEVPAGTYDGLVLGLGVAPVYNATQPGDYTPPHPLDDHYWSWARGYVFAKIEGNADLDRDGIFEQKLTFHMGENQAYRYWQIETPIILGPSSQDLSFVVDLQRVLENEKGDFLDFRKVTQDHSNDMDLVNFLMDNLQSALVMEQN